MICKKCGTEMTSNTVFCPVCGSRADSGESSANAGHTQSSMNPAAQTSNATQTIQMEPSVENVASSVAPEFTPEPEAPKKSSKMKLSIIIAAIVLVLSASVVLAEYFGNFFGWFTTPEEEMKQILTSYIDSFADDAASSIHSLKTAPNIFNGTTSAKMNLSLTNEGKEKVLEIIEQEADPQVIPMIKWINGIGCNMDFTLADTSFSYDLALSANETHIADASCILDVNKGCVYLTVPDLNKTPLRIDLEDSAVEELKEFTSIVSNAKAIITHIPDKTLIKQFMVSNVQTLIDTIKTAEENDDVIEIKDVTQDSTVYTATISTKDIADATKKMLTNLKDDTSIKLMLTAIEKQFGANGLSDQYSKGLDEVIFNINLNDFKAVFGDNITLKIWVDDDDKIIGIELAARSNAIKINYSSATDDDKYASKITAIVDGAVINIDTEGAITSGKFNGSSKLSVIGQNILELKYSNFDVELYKQDIINGSYTLIPSPMILGLIGANELEGYTLTADVAEDATTLGKIKLSVHKDNVLYGSFSLDAAIKSASAIEAPGKSSTNDPEKWLDKANFDTLFNKLKEAGFPSKYLLGFKALLS